MKVNRPAFSHPSKKHHHQQLVHAYIQHEMNFDQQQNG